MINKSVLKQYRYMLKEIQDLENRINRTRDQLQKLENEGNVVDKVSGGEGGLQHFRIEGFPVAEYSAKKTRLLAQMLRYEKNMKIISDLEKEVGDFIDNIPDGLTRMVFRYYYEDGMSQHQIGMELNMDQATASRIIERELDKLA